MAYVEGVDVGHVGPPPGLAPGSGHAGIPAPLGDGVPARSPHPSTSISWKRAAGAAGETRHRGWERSGRSGASGGVGAREGEVGAAESRQTGGVTVDTATSSSSSVVHRPILPLHPSLGVVQSWAAGMWALANLDGSIEIGANMPSTVLAAFLPIRMTEESVVFINVNKKTSFTAALALDSSVGVLDNLAGNTRTDAGTPTARRARSLHCEVADFARTAVATQATAADSPAEVHVDLSGSKSSPSWTSARRLLLPAPSSSSDSRRLGSNIADVPRERARAADTSTTYAQGLTPGGDRKGAGRSVRMVGRATGAMACTEGGRR